MQTLALLPQVLCQRAHSSIKPPVFDTFRNFGYESDRVRFCALKNPDFLDPISDTFYYLFLQSRRPFDVVILRVISIIDYLLVLRKLTNYLKYPKTYKQSGIASAMSHWIASASLIQAKSQPQFEQMMHARVNENVDGIQDFERLNLHILHRLAHTILICY